MPQLQNNNRGLIKSNSGNAPRNPSYINEVKTTEYKNIQKNYATIFGGISNTINNINEKFIELETKKQQIQTENVVNDLSLDYSNRTKQYQMDYKKNPNEEITKQYENDVKVMIDSYEEKVPFSFKNSFIERTNRLQKNANLDFFRKITDLDYQSQKFRNTLDNSLDNVSTNAYLGNQEAIEYEIATLPLKKQQLIDIYGDIDGNKLYNGYTRDFIENYVGGRLSADNTIDAESLLSVIESSEELKNRLTPQEIDNYKIQITEKQNKIKQLQRDKEVVEYLVKTNMTVNDIANNRLNNYTDIVNRLKDTNASENESKMILKFAGYSDKLPPDLIKNGKGGNSPVEKELNRKKTEYEKMQFEKELNDMITFLYGNTKDIDTREKMNDKIKQIQTKLIEGVAGNYITASKHSDYMNILMPYINDVLTRTTKDIAPKTFYVFNNNDLENETNKILEMSNINIEDIENLNKNDKEKYYNIKNRIFNNYIKSMRKQFQDIKQKDVNNKYREVNNWIDFQNVVDKDTRKKLHNRAVKEALTDYTQNELNIKLTGEETNNDLLNYIQTKETNDIINDFKNNIIELQYKKEY